MIINGINIKGIYKYTDDDVFNSGDFVIFDNGIFICTKDNTTGKNPKEDLNNYKPYLFQEESTWEEFKNLYDLGSSNKNGIITSKTLSKILKKINFGIDSKGIITEEVLRNYISPGLEEFTNNNVNVLDQLILDNKNTELNNLTVKVDRVLPGCLITKKPEDLVEVDDHDFKSVLLKQYTYCEAADDSKVGGKIMYRIQELIDHVFGICYYRYARLSEYSNEGNISSWKPSCINAYYLKTLTAFYKAESEKQDNSRFYFKKIEPNAVFTLDNGYQYSVNLENSKTVTITLTKPITTDINTNIYENYSMTVNVDGNEYIFPNNVTIVCENNSIRLKTDNNVGTTISDIYIRVFK